MLTEETIDLICEVLGRLLIEVGQRDNPQIVADLYMDEIQSRAERHVTRMLAEKESGSSQLFRDKTDEWDDGHEARLKEKGERDG